MRTPGNVRRCEVFLDIFGRPEDLVDETDGNGRHMLVELIYREISEDGVRRRRWCIRIGANKATFGAIGTQVLMGGLRGLPSYAHLCG